MMALSPVNHLILDCFLIVIATLMLSTFLFIEGYRNIGIMFLIIANILTFLYFLEHYIAFQREDA